MNGQDYEQLTLFPADFPASPSVWLESRRDGMMTATFGLKCSELSERLRRIGYSVRTYLESCELPRGTWSRVWSARAMTSRCLILKLRLSERRTGGSASRLLPTVTATVGEKGGPNQRDSSGRPGLQMAAALWATPNAMDFLPQRSPEALERQATTTRKGRTRPANLREQVCWETVRMWPTPAARDYKGANSMEHLTRESNNRNHVDQLANAVKLWPTPTQFDGNRLDNHPRADATSTRSMLLSQRILMYPTPRAQTATGPSNPKNRGGGGRIYRPSYPHKRMVVS